MPLAPLRHNDSVRSMEALHQFVLMSEGGDGFRSKTGPGGVLSLAWAGHARLDFSQEHQHA
jgi:hypothetical protein